MKRHALRILLLNLFALAAVAAPNESVVTKSNHSGFTAPEWVRFEQCEVFADKVVITKRLGQLESGLLLTEARPIELGGNLEAVVVAVAKEELTEKDNFLCDGPGTVIQSRKNLIFSTGGCGTPRKERQGNASRMLREIVDAYCPTTHDVGVLN